MDEKKQIKEMAEVICGSGMVDTYSRCEIIAEELYIADYRKQSGWISVDERVPEDGSPVIVYLKSGGITIARYDMAWGRFRTSGSITVTHWMPLPERPKGE